MEIENYKDNKFIMSEEEWKQFQLERWNNEVGTFSDCPKCKGKGWIYGYKNDYLYQIACECRPRTIAMGQSKDAEKVRSFKFNVEYDWQKTMRDYAMRFLANPHGIFYISGTTGCGKTTLCNVMLAALWEDGYAHEIMDWLPTVRMLKELQNTVDYSVMFNKYLNAKVLYIDDFLKVIGNEKASTADLKIAREIIDYRLNNSLITLISSEKTMLEASDKDESFFGRLYQATDKGKNAYNVKGENLRMR